ncbi:uncharacterized protein LOC119558038 [Drosophila subpulchrella]|uniref:uncharacterized protein LOC119558038 n=1 Tax=Drosophila subpulchrella TaxID=1486046 RepID=UPI0018A16899|nr:uncharacterized protein LOC119558038 [Drosophila subpulchrella]
MVNRLTEQLVEAKSKCSDYRKAVKLNAWGSDLEDITICLRMPRLEVLALSVNKINTLSSLQNCHKLKELYLRKNEIPSFEELNYLSNAHSLTSLWLDDNPCAVAAGSKYRACVLRKLPQLKKLDNVDVSEQERQAALKQEYYPAPKSAISSPATEVGANKLKVTNSSSGSPSSSSSSAKACRERIEREEELERQEMERRRERQREQQEQRQLRQRDSFDGLPMQMQELAKPNRSAGGDAAELEGGACLSRTPSGPRTIAGSDHMRMAPNYQQGHQGHLGHQGHQGHLGHQGRLTPQAATQGYRANSSPAATAAAAALLGHGRMDSMDGRRRDLVDNMANGGGVTSVSAQSPVATTSYYAGNAGNSEERRYRQNSNLLSATLCLIREMDAPTLETLSRAIHDQVTSQTMNY